MQTGSALRCVVDSLVEETLALTLDQWHPAGAASPASPSRFFKVYEASQAARGSVSMTLR